MGWAQREFETIDLGDPRLNRRAVLLAEQLGQKPAASIPTACENWAEMVGLQEIAVFVEGTRYARQFAEA